MKAMGNLPADRARALEVAGDFLDELQTTQMTRSYKMLRLLAMLDADAFPEAIDPDALAASFADRGSHIYARDLACRLATRRSRFSGYCQIPSPSAGGLS